MNNQNGLLNLFQCGAECGHQAFGQSSNKSHSVREQYAPAGREAERDEFEARLADALLAGLRARGHAGEQSWRKDLLLVVEYGPNPQCAGLRVHAVVHEVDDPLVRKTFFVGQAKPNGQGSLAGGLGLALVAKIIADHGGIIECESEPKRTVFRVLLPMQRTRPAAVPTARET